jgi:hypothetical protein
MFSEAEIREALVRQRDQARDERDRYRSIITELLALEEGLHSVHYDRAWTRAVETARGVIWEPRSGPALRYGRSIRRGPVACRGHKHKTGTNTDTSKGRSRRNWL